MLAVEEVEEGVAVPSVCSAKPELLHGGMSTARSLPVYSRWDSEKAKGNRERETKAAAERKKVGKLGFAERRRGAGFKEGKGGRGAPMAAAEGCRAVLLLYDFHWALQQST